MGTVLLAIDNGLMWTVTAAGISIVFTVLLVLVMIFYLFGFIMQKASKGNGKKAKKEKTEVTAKADKQVTSVSKAPPAIKVIEDGVSPEVVAAISAAVAAYNDGNQYTIRSIKKQQVSAGRPAWSMAGVADNTRPF